MKKPGRYDRQEILSEIGPAGQKKLTNARVLMVGAGGLGCSALQYMAAAGIGTLGIIDHDSIDISNLQRQVLFTTEDHEKKKAVAARARLLQLNSDIIIHAYAERLTQENVLGLFSSYDLIIDGTDNFVTKFLINDAAVKTSKPVVYGAIEDFAGQISVFDAVHGPCYRCLHPQPPQNHVLNCAETGVIGALAGIIGSMQAMEAIKLIVGHESFKPLIGKLWMIDTRTMETRMINILKQKDCTVCSKKPIEIILQNSSPVCAATMVMEINGLDMAKRHDVITIDVRELSEREDGYINGSLHIPLDVLQKNINAFSQPEGGKICVLYCQKGGRSKKAAEWLMTAGFKNIYSLKGGFEAWISGR